MQPKNKRMTLFTRSVNFFFKKNLLFTNSITSGGFMGIGDLIQQEFEHRSSQNPEHKKSSLARYDWIRAGRMFIVGGLMGPGHHYYYQYLDRALPRRDIKTVAKKVLADQLICSPATIVFFFFGMALLERKTLTQFTTEIREKFKYVYLADCLFWPPVQCVNFYYLHPRYRCLYINVATMVFDVFLSYMKHDF